MKSLLYVVLVIALVAIGLFIGPFLLIWALNTLFGLAIVFGWKTWAAALILLVVINARGKKGD